MDGPTIKTDNLYSFSLLIDQVFETVIAMWKLQSEPHFKNSNFALKSVLVLLRIIRWCCSLFRMIIDFTKLDFHYSSGQIIKVLNFLNGQISEKTY